MKFRYLSILAVMLLAACGPTETVEKSEPVPDPVKADKSVSDGDAKPADAPKEAPESATPSSKDRFAAVSDKFNAAMSKFSKAYRELPKGDNEARQKLFDDLYPNPNDYVEDMMAVADEFPGEEGAFEALNWVATRVRKDPRKEKAISQLIENYIDREGFERIASSLTYGSIQQSTIDQLNKIIEESPHDSVKATAIMSLAKFYSNAQRAKQTIKDNPDVEYFGDEEKSFVSNLDFPEELVDSLYDRLTNEFGDLKPSERSKRTYAMLAESARFEANRLQIGMVAPDITGNDLDGTEFKLSDYRGKVVLLDFWGDW